MILRMGESQKEITGCTKKNSTKLSFKATHGIRIKGVKLGNKNNTRK